MLQIPELTPAEYAEWDDFVERSPQGTVFAKSHWLHGFEQLSSENKVRVLIVRDTDGSIQGGVPLFVRGSGRRASVEVPSLTAYTSLLLAPRSRKDENREAEWEMKTIGAILAQLRCCKFGSVRLFHTPSLIDIREFSWQGWNATPRYTYVRSLDTSNFVDELSKNHGKNFRKAARAGYTVAATQEFSRQMDAFLALFQNSYKTMPACYSSDCQVVRTMCQTGMGKGMPLLYEARDARGEVQAARIVWLSCHGKVMDWAAATTDAGRSDGATAFLVTKMFEDLRSRQYCEFDFCGANIQSIAQFKAGFNAILVPYYATHIGQFKILNSLKNALRTLIAAGRSRG